MREGYIQLYMGDGKGKTTSAIGLSIRALGAGLKVAFLQFFKTETSSEVRIFRKFEPHLLYKCFHSGGFVKGKPSKKLIEKIQEGYNLFLELLQHGDFDLIVLDEFVYALNWNIISLSDFIEKLKNKPKGVEIVITGREVPEELLDLADLVTEMKKVKHYFDRGVKARWGIEK
ncbi:MAG: cob(I)yrinic acid a,c-diamide adenosyltransferase [Caldimicrobium sp.]|nr:cob(I)yrinic acid a,c-diamide adenosyltransferase [Caldimicrobium sp.]MCX7613434.1 cob(I)yrinic acid a,c-diamide adenosyltransferase [Caldimicrobium sp.]MDW8183029.1 cob(I)yrinic acid a,c-diamide adenosyltransferase [Caldimicrobium sp.]